MISVKKAADRLGVGVTSMYMILNSGRLNHYRFGKDGKGKIMIDETELEQFIRNSRVDVAKAVSPDNDGDDGKDEQLTYLNLS